VVLSDIMADEPRIVDSPVHVPVEAIAVGPSGDAAMRDIFAAEIPMALIGFAYGYGLHTLAMSPFFADLERDKFIKVEPTVAKYKLVHRHVVGLLRFLATQDVFKEEANETFHLTPKGKAAVSKGSVGWIKVMIGGYGNLMHHANALMAGELTYHKDIHRQAREVSVGSSMLTSSIGDEVPYRVIERAGAHVVADLGCGGGGFLIEWVKRDPKNRGVGIDLAPAAIDAATTAAREAGVSDRCKFVVGNCFDLSVVAPQCKDVEFFYSFALEHEVMTTSEQAVLDHIDAMADLFPGKRYLVGEPMLNMAVGDGHFYWVHVLSLQGYPRNVPGWSNLFKRFKVASLERVYVPDHQRIGGFFDIRLGAPR
jgi:SAM-dependent methyltransferase